jgi:hypothetical protein
MKVSLVQLPEDVLKTCWEVIEGEGGQLLFKEEIVGLRVWGEGGDGRCWALFFCHDACTTEATAGQDKAMLHINRIM